MYIQDIDLNYAELIYNEEYSQLYSTANTTDLISGLNINVNLHTKEIGTA